MSLLDAMRRHCTDDGGCLIWQRGTVKGHPSCRLDGRAQLVRRALFADINGNAVPKGRVLRITCGQLLCIEPAHCELTTYKAIAVECGKLGLMGGPVRSARIAATKRAGPQARTTQEVVRLIRASVDSGADLARRHGISENLVSGIRRHKVWREHVTPFSGLVA